MYLCNPVALLFLLLYLYIFASFNLVWLILTISHFLYFTTFLTVSQYCSQNFHNLIYQSTLFRCEVPRLGIYYCFPWYIVLLFQLQKTVLIGRITFRYATFLGRRQYSTVLYLSCLPLGTSWFRGKNCPSPYCLYLFVKFLYFSTYQYLFAQKGTSPMGEVGEVIWPKVNLVL